LDAALDGFLDRFFPAALHLDHIPFLVIRHRGRSRCLRRHIPCRRFRGAEVCGFFSHADTFYHSYHGVFSDALSCSARTSTRRTPIASQLRTLIQIRSTTNKKVVSRATATNTTTVSWTSRLREVQETLFISASVAIKKSVNTGQLTTRQDTH